MLQKSMLHNTCWLCLRRGEEGEEEPRRKMSQAWKNTFFVSSHSKVLIATLSIKPVIINQPVQQ